MRVRLPRSQWLKVWLAVADSNLEDYISGELSVADIWDDIVLIYIKDADVEEFQRAYAYRFGQPYVAPEAAAPPA